MDVPLLLTRLRTAYPDAKCALDHRNPFELLIATILSAQCTDARVNMVTPTLFARFPDAEAMSRASQEELEELVRTTGFFRNKSKSIRGASERLVGEFGGVVPRSMDELLRLPGVARKTASVVLGVSYGVAEGVVVDTHVARVSRRLGLTRNGKVEKIEHDLMKAIPREDWIEYSHLIIFHGRRVCDARKPKCPVCPVQDLCPSAKYFLAGNVPPWERRMAAERGERRAARAVPTRTSGKARKVAAKSKRKRSTSVARTAARGRKAPRLKRS
ncbi:MAG TPA: endonuclease III [Candidatus Eisenbacteria bacterium]|nr:endonuclease III [Candidatus Eisenbacteria bacterium]